MGWFRVAQFDSAGGAVGDLPPQSVPPNVFTGVQNVMFSDGVVRKAAGMVGQLGTVPLAPYFLLSGQDNAANIKLFAAGLQAIYQFSSGAWSAVTRTTGGAYNSESSNAWTGGILHGVPYCNNGTDAPQSWDASTSKFLNLPNWPSGYTCKVMRHFKNYMFGLDVTISGTRYPHNVLWSHPADPGAVPGTNAWDYSDPTKDAGFTPLSETPGYLVDGLPLGNQLVLYKEDSIYTAQFTGAPYIFTFRLAQREAGAMSRNCIAEAKGMHVVLTKDDVIAFDGAQTKSLIGRRWRRDLFNTIAADSADQSFVVTLPSKHEVWVCIPTASTPGAQLAYVWNYQENTWSKRELPNVQSIVSAFPPSAIVPGIWTGDSVTWDEDTTAWSSFLTLGKAILLASPVNTDVFTLDASEAVDGITMECVAQHDSFDFADAKAPDTADAVKHVSKIRPRVIADVGTILEFYVGTQMNVNDVITWTNPMYFTVGTTDELCLAVNGRYISWKVRSFGTEAWQVEAIDFLIRGGGRF